MIGVLAPWNMDALLTSQRGMDGNLTNVYFRVESPALFDDVTRQQCFAVRIKYGTNCTWLNIHTHTNIRAQYETKNGSVALKVKRRPAKTFVPFFL